MFFILFLFSTSHFLSHIFHFPFFIFHTYYFKVSACRRSRFRARSSVEGYRRIRSSDQIELLKYVAMAPVAVGICGTDKSFMFCKYGYFYLILFYFILFTDVCVCFHLFSSIYSCIHLSLSSFIFCLLKYFFNLIHYYFFFSVPLFRFILF